MSRARLEPGPDHPITVTPTPTEVVVRAAGRLVARTTRALTLQESDYPPVQYVPLADVDPSLLSSSSTQTYCPYKGECSYYDVVTDGGSISDAAWTYATPYPAVAEIAGHLAFYPTKLDIQVGS